VTGYETPKLREFRNFSRPWAAWVTARIVTGRASAAPPSAPLAVALENGLIVPVVRGADEKNVAGLQRAIAIRSICLLSLSFDHRLIDGALADQFMTKVKQATSECLQVAGGSRCASLHYLSFLCALRF
jgi:hypothetical protein